MTDTMHQPEPPKGVRWPNHLHTEAPHPSATIRGDIMRNALGGTDKWGYTDHGAYQFVLSAVLELQSANDRYLFRQYFHRDMALQALKDGDLNAVREHLNAIGK